MTTLHTPEDVARVAAKIVGMDLGLSQFLSRDFESDFGGGSGSTVRVRVPGAVEASTRDSRDTTTPLVKSAIVEQTIPVTLNTLAYSDVPLAPGHYDLDLTDYASQILRPQALALVKYVERGTVTAFQATPLTAMDYDPERPARLFTTLRAELRDRGVGTDEPLYAAVGTNVYSALQDAIPATAGVTFDDSGKVRGFQVVESSRLGADEVVAFVKPAFSLVVRAPRVPDGATYGASVTESGFALTAIRAFDTSTASDRSIVQALVAVQAMPLAVDQEDGTVDLIEHGGAIRVDTSATTP